nr:hypothetical protein [Tanacetum cinerariifolium]
MSSASSAVTYTFVYIDSEPGRVFWGADEELSDGGSPRVIDEDEEEEDEHLASVDTTIVVPTIEPVSSPGETEPVIPPPSIDITITVWL